MSARDDILAAVRDASARKGAAATPPVAWRQIWAPGEEALLARFLDRLEAYGVHADVLDDRRDIAGAIARRLAARGSNSFTAPEDLPADWFPPGRVASEGASHEALNEIEAVVTAATVAVAETGSVALDCGEGQGARRLTLLPDHHICILFADQLVGVLPEALARLRPAIEVGRPITFFSGPSATADIEFDRVVGVHGPRKLDVVIVRARG